MSNKSTTDTIVKTNIYVLASAYRNG